MFFFLCVLVLLLPLELRPFAHHALYPRLLLRGKDQSQPSAKVSVAPGAEVLPS